MSEGVVTCKSSHLGEGCGHPTTDHVGDRTTQVDCCCCTRKQNDMGHVDACLDCAIKHGKRQVRIRTGNLAPTTGEVEPFIPDALKRAFWQRYIGRYFDSAPLERAYEHVLDESERGGH